MVDALDAEPGPVDVLAFPLQAPWQRSRDMTAFLRGAIDLALDNHANAPRSNVWIQQAVNQYPELIF